METAKQQPTHYHDLNPTYFLQRAALIEPNARAIVHKARNGRIESFTYQQMERRVAALANFFQKHQLKRVAILGPNTPAHLETMFAGVASGGIIMGLNYRLKKREIEYMLDLGQADVVIVDEEFAHLVDANRRTVIVDKDAAGEDPSCQYQMALDWGKRNDLESFVYAEHGEDDLLGLFFTSGTTGNPKAVEYSHRGVYLAALSNVIESGMNSQDIFGANRCRYLWTLPMFHAAGWTCPYAVTAARGTHFCLRKIETDYIWDLLRDEKITHYNAAPTVNTMLLNSPKATKLDQAVRVIVAASPPSPKLFEDMLAHNLHPVHMYGLTETYGPFTRAYFQEEWASLSSEEVAGKLARQGHSFLTSQELRVVDERGNDVAMNGKVIGEIVIKGNAVTKGYHRNADETSKAFNKFFRSGDLAVWHSDGAIQVLDRKKDIIISGGENISSVSVESEIVKYPNVCEAAVVGAPDEVYGELPIAFVTLKDKSLSPPDMASLIEFLRSHMGHYQVPKKIFFVDELPKTSTGKVKKNVLRDLYKENPERPLV